MEQIGQIEMKSELEEACWAVITFDSVVAHHLTYEEALSWAERLERQMQNGVCIVTDEVAERIQSKKIKTQE